MQKYIRSIPVRDAQGVELTLYEYRVSEWRRVVGWLRYPRLARRFILDTGEPALQVAEDTFVLCGSGELLSKRK